MGHFHDPEADRRRDAWLSAHGFRVLRFDNGLIQTQGERVLDAILQAIAAPPAGPDIEAHWQPPI